MDASDVIRRKLQFTQFVGYAMEQRVVQPTTPFSTLCTFYASTTIHRFPTYESYNNVTQGLKYFVSSCTG